jgi:hypothetical protein
MAESLAKYMFLNEESEEMHDKRIAPIKTYE